MTANVINKHTAVELEHPSTGKICLANCICCAKSELIEKGLFEDSPSTYICTKINKYKNLKRQKPFRILADLNYCCAAFKLSRDFTNLGYKVIGKYRVGMKESKKVVK